MSDAMQVLYGQKCLLQDDFSDKELQDVGSVVIGKAVKDRQDQLSVYNAVHSKIELYAAELISAKRLTGLQRWQQCAQMAVSRRNKAS